MARLAHCGAVSWNSTPRAMTNKRVLCGDQDEEPVDIVLRAASLARKVYLRQKLGVGGLRKHYGGKNKRKVWARMPGTDEEPQRRKKMVLFCDCRFSSTNIPAVY